MSGRRLASRSPISTASPSSASRARPETSVWSWRVSRSTRRVWRRPPWRYLVELAGELSGFPRHVSQHSGGMIISSAPLVDLVPVQPASMQGRYLCQWDKDSCDDAGFIKIDFLALGMLSLVEEALRLIPANGKPPVDLSRIDFTDQAVYDMICAGDTIGTFQIESRAQIQTLLRTQPRCLEDLVVQVAIVRPGPIIGGAVNPYVQHRELDRRGLAPRRPTIIPFWNRSCAKRWVSSSTRSRSSGWPWRWRVSAPVRPTNSVAP